MKSRPLGTDPKSIMGVVVPDNLPSGKRRSMVELLKEQGLWDADSEEPGDKKTPPPVESTEGSPAKKTTDQLDNQDGEAILEISIDQIQPSRYQPRRIFDQDKLEELADSIREAGGLTNPINIRFLGDDRYELITGERRWRAHRLLGWSKIKARVRVLSDAAAQILALTDNIDAEPLTAYEEARALRDLLDNNIATSHSDLARKTGRNKVTIGRQMSFFSLPPVVIGKLDENPRLLSQRVATDLAAYSEADAEVVVEAVEAIEMGKLEPTAAGTWVKNKIRARSRGIANTRPRVVTFAASKSGLTKARITGKKITLECSSNTDPGQVLAELAKALGITINDESTDKADS